MQPSPSIPTPRFELASLRRPGTVTEQRVRLTSVSSTSPVCTLEDGRVVPLPWSQRVWCIDSLVEEGGEDVCVEADLSGERIVSVRICVRCAPHESSPPSLFGPSSLALCGEVSLVAVLSCAWRDVVVVAEKEADVDPEELTRIPMDEEATGLVLFPHQREAVERLRALEDGSASLPYSGNLLLSPGLYLDTEEERLTTDPSWRSAETRGGLLCNPVGTGKTATMLHHCLWDDGSADERVEEDRREASGCLVSRATLVVVPLNLPPSWAAEAERVRPGSEVVRMIHGKDAKTRCMADLLRADVVVTTAHFLRDSRSYADLVEDAVSVATGISKRDARTRAAVAAFARVATPSSPAVLEAIHWRRVVVDELHELLLSGPRLVKSVRCLRADWWWGISATMEAVTEDVPLSHQLYWLLLRREKAHHPHLLEALLGRCVVRTACPPSPHACLRTLRLVPDREGRDEAGRGGSVPAFPTPLSVVEREVIRVTSVSTSDQVEAWDATTLCRRVEAAIVGAPEPPPLCEDAVTRRALQSSLHELPFAEDAPPLLDLLLRGGGERRRPAARREYVDAQIRSILDKETCPVCMDAPCGVVVTPCGHVFCRPCLTRQTTCPTCRHPVSPSDLKGVIASTTDKMVRMADFVESVTTGRGGGGGGEAVVLFVQWRSLLRDIRSLLRGRRVRVHLLEGNATHRARTLHDFECDGGGGGVLLLSLEDTFAGLHLPAVRHIVFSHAIVGDDASVRSLECQAIGRCLRSGQTRDVLVHSFVVKDSVEEEMWRRTHEGDGSDV